MNFLKQYHLHMHERRFWVKRKRSKNWKEIYPKTKIENAEKLPFHSIQWIKCDSMISIWNAQHYGFEEATSFFFIHMFISEQENNYASLADKNSKKERSYWNVVRMILFWDKYAILNSYIKFGWLPMLLAIDLWEWQV